MSNADHVSLERLAGNPGFDHCPHRPVFRPILLHHDAGDWEDTEVVPDKTTELAFAPVQVRDIDHDLAPLPLIASKALHPFSSMLVG